MSRVLRLVMDKVRLTSPPGHRLHIPYGESGSDHGDSTGTMRRVLRWVMDKVRLTSPPGHRLQFPYGLPGPLWSGVEYPVR